MGQKVLSEQTFYRIYDREGNEAAWDSPEMQERWIEKGKAPFLEWGPNDNTIRVWKKIYKVEKVTLRNIETVEVVKDLTGI